jgi:hypothetical protein
VPQPARLVGSPRPLPPLDYDESAPRLAPGARPKQLEVTRPGIRRSAGRIRWFVLGIAVGAVAAAAAGGGARSARAWAASALRSFEHHPSSVAPVAASSTTTVSLAHVVRSSAGAPCPIDPGPDDPCAELLAPFAATTSSVSTVGVPTVSIDDLPKVPLAPPVVIARRRPHSAPATRASTSEDESAESDTPSSGVGVNPDDDSSTPRIPRALPRPAPDRPAAEPPASEQPSAKNEPT